MKKGSIHCWVLGFHRRRRRRNTSESIAGETDDGFVVSEESLLERMQIMYTTFDLCRCCTFLHLDQSLLCLVVQLRQRMAADVLQGLLYARVQIATDESMDAALVHHAARHALRHFDMVRFGVIPACRR
jgi:hypothetical protein